MNDSRETIRPGRPRRPWDLFPGQCPAPPGAELEAEILAGQWSTEDPVPFVLSYDDAPITLGLTPAGAAAGEIEQLARSGMLAGIEPGIIAAAYGLVGLAARFWSADHMTYPVAHEPGDDAADQ